MSVSVSASVSVSVSVDVDVHVRDYLCASAVKALKQSDTGRTDRQTDNEDTGRTDRQAETQRGFLQLNVIHSEAGVVYQCVILIRRLQHDFKLRASIS